MSRIISYKYDLYIKGKKLENDRLQYVTDIVHNYSSNGADSLTLKISDPSMVFIDDNIYTESVPIKFNALLDNSSRINFSGYISAIDIMFPNIGIPELTIHCMDDTYIMNGSPKKRTWKKKKVSDVVRQVIRPYNFIPHIDDTFIQEESISQSNQTDITFLKDLCNKTLEPYLCYLSGNHFYFVRRRLNIKAQKTINYRKNGFEVISFNPQITKESKKQDVTTANVSLLTSQIKKHIANDMNVDRDLLGNTFIRKSEVK